MGVTSRVFICADADLDRLRSGECNGDDFEGGQGMSAVTGLHLHIIWAAIDGCVWDPEKHAGTAISDDDVFIELAPPRLVAAFASIGDADAKRVASELAPTEDFGWSADEVFELIVRVRDVATRASGRRVCIETSW